MSAQQGTLPAKSVHGAGNVTADPSRPATAAASSAHEVVARGLLASLHAFEIANEDPGHALDPEATHDARVALRRMRSILRSFSKLFADDDLKTLREDLRWYGGLLGAIRDLDVTEERLHAQLDGRDPSERAQLVRYLHDEREARREALRVGREDPRYQQVLVDLAHLRQMRPLERPGATDVVLRAFVHRPYEKLRKAAARATRTAKEEDLHDLRIRAKELRYAAELCVDELGPRWARLARRAKLLQDRIGEHRDARRTMQFLEEYARHAPRSSEIALDLREVERDRARETIRGWRKDVARVEAAWRGLPAEGC